MFGLKLNKSLWVIFIHLKLYVGRGIEKQSQI